MHILARHAAKINSQEGDGHTDGEQFLLLGETLIFPELEGAQKLYIGLFQDFHLPVFVADIRVKDLGTTEVMVIGDEILEYLATLPQDIFNLYTIENEDEESKKD